MLIKLRLYRPLLGLALMLLVAGCATHAPSPARVAGSDQNAHPRTSYKVGAPYQVNGVWYYPAEDLSYDETGIASWYGPNFQEKFTANGEVFDQNALSAAHKTLPLPSIVQVTNLDNGRVIELRVNDRGPFVGNRIIDLSRRAAQLLGFEQAGTAKVRVKIMVPETMQTQSIARANGDETPPVDVPHAAPRDTVVAQTLLPPPSAKAAPRPAPIQAAPLRPVAPPIPVPTPVPTPAQLAAAEPRLPDTVKVVPVKSTQIYIQVGAFAVGANAIKMKARLDGLGPVLVTGARVNGMDIFRVRLGPIATVDEADQLLAKAVGAGASEARIVVD